MKKLIVLTSLLLSAAGCGGAEDVTVTKDLQTVRADVGGLVIYALSDDEPLEGVTVTLTDAQGTQFSATTTAQGLWFVADLAPGPYSVLFSLAGYIDEVVPFSIELNGENDVDNVYVGLGTVLMNETGPVVTLSGVFSLSVDNEDFLIDTVAGTSAVYGLAAGGDLVMTSDMPAFIFLFEVEDVAGTVSGTANTAQTVFTIAGTALQALPLTADNELSTTDTLDMGILWFTPIHGDFMIFQAQLQFNVVP